MMRNIGFLTEVPQAELTKYFKVSQLIKDLYPAYI